jgi:hypothetical protein
LLAIGNPAVVLAPRHLRRVGVEVLAGDVVVNADLGATRREKKLSAMFVQVSGVEYSSE